MARHEPKWCIFFDFHTTVPHMSGHAMVVFEE